MATEYQALPGATGEEDITVSTVVKNLVVPGRAKPSGRALVQVRTAGIVYTLNGVNPTVADASTGLTLSVGDTLVVVGAEMTSLAMIRATGSDGLVHVRYEMRTT